MWQAFVSYYSVGEPVDNRQTFRRHFFFVVLLFKKKRHKRRRKNDLKIDRQKKMLKQSGRYNVYSFFLLCWQTLFQRLQIRHTGRTIGQWIEALLLFINCGMKSIDVVKLTRDEAWPVIASLLDNATGQMCRQTTFQHHFQSHINLKGRNNVLYFCL
jgi:hypothetical protein